MMSESAKYRLQMFCASGGFWYMGVLLVGWAFIAGFLPPHHPSWDANQIATIFRTEATRIRIGMVFLMIGAALCMPFTAAASRYLHRIEGSPGMLTYGMLMGGVGNMVLTFYPAIFWLVAAYRPERPDELILLMNDWAWIQLLGGATMFWTMPLTMAIGAICDRSADPVFPRWSGYLCLFLFLIILPDQLLFFFKTGPFAWNGIFGIWIPVGGFGGWFALTSTLMMRAMKRGVYPDSPISVA